MIDVIKEKAEGPIRHTLEIDKVDLSPNSLTKCNDIAQSSNGPGFGSTLNAPGTSLAEDDCPCF